MPQFIRNVVSGPKQRFVDKELRIDLDLSYVSDNIVIMGYPASAMEALYRNPRDDVLRFLEARHGRKWRIYNFCPCYENSYDADFFHGQVKRYPFPDHHAPPLPYIPLAIRDMCRFLAEDPENVVVIHCKAGKGRSGTMACCLLMALSDVLPGPSRYQSKKPAPSRSSGTTSASASASASAANSEDGASVQPTSPTAKAEAAESVIAEHVNPSPSSSTSHLTSPASDSTPPAPDTPILAEEDAEKGLNESPTEIQAAQLGAEPGLTPAERAREVIRLHTQRRMKPKSRSLPAEEHEKRREPSKWRTGVSIPSQKRWIHYWATALPPKVTPSTIPRFLPPGLPGKGGGQKSGVRFVELDRIEIRMREQWGGIGKKLLGLATGTDLSIHLARYSDELISELEDWEARDAYARPNEPPEPSLFEGTQWDSDRMISRFAEFGESRKERSHEQDGDASLQVRIMRPAEKLTLDADREVRVRVVYGQVSIGWIWLVLAFHTSPFEVKKIDIDFTKGAGVGVDLQGVTLFWNDADTVDDHLGEGQGIQKGGSGRGFGERVGGVAAAVAEGQGVREGVERAKAEKE